ncbi:MAG: DUF5334 family protein [Vampirovibrionia bacterium]
MMKSRLYLKFNSLFILTLLLISLFYPIPCIGWSGYESITGDYIDINPKDVKKENVVDYYDYNSGEYRTGIVERVYQRKDIRKIELQDIESSSFRNFDMENVKNDRKILKKYYNY